MRLYSTFVAVRRSLVAALTGAVACGGVLAITEPPGPGLDPDSMSYVGAAESLARHHALRIPAGSWSDADSTAALGHFPPGFPLAIALPVMLGAPPVQAARGVEAAAAFATVALAAWLVGTAAGAGAGLLAGAVFLVTPSFAFDHWQVVSEPLCIALLVATLVLMVTSRRPWTYGLAAAAAGMVRYAAFASTGAVAVWAYGVSGGRAERLRRAAVAAAPSILAQSVWWLRTAAEKGEVRHFGLRGAWGPTLRELGGTLGTWLAPSVPSAWLAAPVAAAVGAFALFVIVRAARADEAAATEPAVTPRRVVGAAALLMAVYAALVLFSRLFVDLTIPLDLRLLSPFIVLAQVGAVTAFGAAWRGWRRGVRVTAALVWTLWLAGSAHASVVAVRDALDGGWGYAGDEWRTSRLGEYLRTEARAAAIFSNNTATAYFVTGRPSRDVPGSLDQDSVVAFGRVLRERRGVLVRFPFDLRSGAPPDSLANRLGLIEMARFPDGVVWRSAGRGRPRS
jgi:hypothetical protein